MASKFPRRIFQNAKGCIPFIIGQLTAVASRILGEKSLAHGSAYYLCIAVCCTSQFVTCELRSGNIVCAIAKAATVGDCYIINAPKLYSDWLRVDESQFDWLALSSRLIASFSIARSLSSINLPNDLSFK